ncbi:MAG TPA: hypothetical protein VGO66_10145 [Solirubrobacterales bacterium]|jgi:hypothetical protein|nr:hypothetical protein [Solirubrobacterales bacterium]
MLAPSTAASSEFWADILRSLDDDFEDPAEGKFQLRREPIAWSSPAAAIAELQADLRSGKTVLDPVRFVLPLLTHAVRLRLRNGLAMARHARTCAVLLLFVVVVGPYIGLALAAGKMEKLARSRRRRANLTRTPGRSAAADSPRRRARP